MKSKNYLGKPDENRGILIALAIFVVIFALVFIINVISKSHDIEEVVFEEDFAVAEKTTATISKLEVTESKVLIEGLLKAGLTQARIIKLRDVDLVLRANQEDKYEFNLGYHISAEDIDFSTKLKDSIVLDLNQIEPGEYKVFLRVKSESSSNEQGYAYKYYSLASGEELQNIEQEGLKISFDKYKGVLDYLTITKIQVNEEE